MITHNTNLNHLIDIDNVVFPSIQARATSITDGDNKVWFLYDFGSKVTVKGRNGEKYYIPVIESFKTDVSNLELMFDRFKAKCKSVRDQYITTEGRDVLAEDYLKIKNFKTKYIGDDRV